MMHLRRAVGYQPIAFGNQVASCGKANTNPGDLYLLRLREGERRVRRRHHAEDVERHRDHHVVAEDADQLDHALVAKKTVHALVSCGRIRAAVLYNSCTKS